MYTYSIHIGSLDYVSPLVDNDAKIVWEIENEVIYRKRLDGKFSLSRSDSPYLYDKIRAMGYCDTATLTVSNKNGVVIEGSFKKKDLTISSDKCSISIKFDRIDEYTELDTIMDKDVNILTMPILAFTAVSTNLPLIEHFNATGFAYSDSYWVGFGGEGWMGDGCSKPIIPYPEGSIPNSSLWIGMTSYQEEHQWTFQQNYYKFIEEVPGLGNKFEITSFYERQVIYVTRVGGEQSPTPSNTGDPCDKYGWVFDNYNQLTNQDIFARKTEISSFIVTPETASMNKSDVIMYSGIHTANCYSETYKYTRCRKLNNVIFQILPPSFAFKSEFFNSTVNPISGADLSNLLIAQKSDCIGTTSNPAIKGILTFKKLMDLLTNMFNVYWAIDSNGDFRIEHKFYWDNNESYFGYPNKIDNVGIDLTAIYPISLEGTAQYSFESNIPIREKFSFMESWRTDFIGTDIDYSNCIKVGASPEHPAPEITTDIDPYLMLAYASKEGFCMFHCNRESNSDESFNVTLDYGKITGQQLENAHLSWANLQDAYWKYGRYLPSGLMNSKETDFYVRPLKYQIPITFPYCVNNFNPQKSIRTDIGDGIIKTASFSLKTEFFTIELEYIDNN